MPWVVGQEGGQARREGPSDMPIVLGAEDHELRPLGRTLLCTLAVGFQ